MAYVLGIDLGTTNSCVAVLEGGEPTVIENSEGDRTTPSVVGITAEEEQLIGQIARRQAITNPENTAYSIKRFMGRKFDDPDVQRDLDSLPYSVIAAENGDATIHLADHSYAPPQISAMVLAKIKTDVEARVGEEVTQAVITVPAYFDDTQRQATKDAGRIAGLEVLRIINEPTAAALAYGLGRSKEEVVAVYDLGGGTFDISILQLNNDIFEVKSTNGDTHLGGDDFDACIIEWLASEFEKEHNIDLRKDRMALQRLKEAAERAKVELSSLIHARINLPFISSGPEGPLHLVTMLTRSKLEGLVADLVEATAEPCRRALADAHMTAENIDTVILVGGQSRMPAVQTMVRELFGKAPSSAVNPDEVVALGAAIQAGILTGVIENVMLLDVTPLTLGVEIQGGEVAPLIPRNTKVPTMCSEVFTTALDGQDTVDVHVTQGERPVARENRSLARFHLDGIPYALRGIPQIEVTFALDANGILNVAARDLTTGRAQHVTITPSGGLSTTEVERMVDEAEQYKDQDRVRQDTIALRNEADVLVYKASRAVRTAEEALEPEQKANIEWSISALEKSLPTGDSEQIRERMKSVRQMIDSLQVASD